MGKLSKIAASGAIAKPSRTVTKEVRRQQLINATIESIAKHGITGTTLTTVTGLSMGLVNFHFTNKETLFAETLRFVAQEHRDQWKKSFELADLTAPARLLAIVDAHYHPRICNRKKLAVWFGFYGDPAYRAKYREIMQEIDPERWEISIDICRQIIVEGDYEGVDPVGVADTLEGLYDGFCLNILIYPREFNRQDAMKGIRTILATTFPGHFDHPSQS